MDWNKNIYLGLLVLAAPAYLWSALEMYVLTLGGSQMLFYSIVHAMPVLLMVTSVSAIFFIILFIYNLIQIPMYKFGKSSIATRVIIIVLFSQLFHVALLFLYEEWSLLSLRVPICLLGLGVLVAGSGMVFRSLLRVNQGLDQGRY